MRKYFLAIVLLCSFTLHASEKVVIATWNLRWFFDDDKTDNRGDIAKNNSAPSKQAWEWKKSVVAESIAKLKPTILALQEIESDKVLAELVKELKDKHNAEYEYMFVQGQDSQTEQDVGLLVKKGVEHGAAKRFSMRDKYKDKDTYKFPSKHLVAEFDLSDGTSTEHVKVVVVHLLASGAAVQRAKQGAVVREEIKDSLNDNVIVLGDYNTHVGFDTNAEKNEGVGVVKGLQTNSTADDLYDVDAVLTPEKRKTHRGESELDRILISKRLQDGGHLTFESADVRRDLCVRGSGLDRERDYWGGIKDDERDVSDHFPLTSTFEFSH